MFFFLLLLFYFLVHFHFTFHWVLEVHFDSGTAFCSSELVTLFSVSFYLGPPTLFSAIREMPVTHRVIAGRGCHVVGGSLGKPGATVKGHTETLTRSPTEDMLWDFRVSHGLRSPGAHLREAGRLSVSKILLYLKHFQCLNWTTSRMDCHSRRVWPSGLLLEVYELLLAI